MEGWTPQDVTIASVDVFPAGSGDSPYAALVATLEPTPNLLEANARLKLLPHCETYPLEYKPHVTLCYLNNMSDAQGYIGHEMSEHKTGQSNWTAEDKKL